VDDAITRYRAARGFLPLAPYSLVAEGFLSALPIDPAGGDWTIDAEGRARSTAHARRIGRAPRPHELRPEPGLGRAQGAEN
jgi:hypothetical protein